jgi:predicted DNA-binding transcriptional regulator AlpA
MIPFDYMLWDADECARYFGISKDYFLRKKRNQPGFPKPVSEDNEQPRWSAKSVAEWALNWKFTQNLRAA